MEAYILIGLKVKDGRGVENIVKEIKSNLEYVDDEFGIEGFDAINFTREIEDLEKVRNDLAELLEKFK